LASLKGWSLFVDAPPRDLEPLIMNLPKAEERREAVRYPLARLAKIQLAQGNPPRYCVVTDISNGGVRIDTTGFNVPDEFVLFLSGDGPAQDGTYQVIWRCDDEIGAKLLNSSISTN
jgi:hypothetical protein